MNDIRRTTAAEFREALAAAPADQRLPLALERIEELLARIEELELRVTARGF